MCELILVTNNSDRCEICAFLAIEIFSFIEYTDSADRVGCKKLN